MAEIVCAASRDLPLDKESAWDGAAAKAAVFAWAGWPDNPDPAKAAKGFLAYDRSQGKLKGSFHLPFATVKSGTLTAVAAGIRAAASRLPQTDGLPASVAKEARAVIDAYEKKMGKGENSLSGEKFASTLRVRPGADTEALMTLVRANAADPTIFDESPPYFWSVEGSNTREDAYSTLMHSSTLKNFADEATAGVSFQNSHRTDELGFGRTLQGRFIGAGGNGVARMEADVFTTPGLNLNGVNTDDLIRGIRSGLVKDVSVGFYLGPDGFYRCNICNERLMTNGCRHYPGVLYAPEEKEGAALVKATASIHNAHLAEISAVYDGATPSAGVLKARWAMEAGTLEPEIARQLETCYRIKLPASHRAWAAGFIPEEKPMADEPTKPTPGETPTDTGILQAFHRSIAAALAEVPLPPESRADEPATLIRRLGAELIELRPLRDKVGTLETKVAELTPQAEDGVAFRTELRQAVEAEYVRARGSQANVAVKAESWDRASIAYLKAEYLEYAGQAFQLFGGGRASVDQGDPKPGTNGTQGFVTPAPPPAVYRA